MIIQDYINVNLTHTNETFHRQIEIKKTQLQIARDSNMRFVAETLQQQLDELHQDHNFNALMTLFDD
ncbi:hypothetical protein NIES4071_04310 [Calothrix sp. NIES-4071]|nr:hypothetical protein NIES4071_04310 [Calothrix sp. NIES-4071]BAZ54777.1 hypothetical protein NIES4105_04300 [Calothrix sp. NIES-4105]